MDEIMLVFIADIEAQGGGKKEGPLIGKYLVAIFISPQNFNTGSEKFASA